MKKHLINIVFLFVYTQTAVGQLPVNFTLSLQPTANAGKDAMLDTKTCTVGNPAGNSANINNGTSGIIGGIAWTYNTINCSSGVARGLLEFDGMNLVPSLASNLTANLYLYGPANAAEAGGWSNGSSQLSGSNITYIRRVTNTWNESTVTWNTQPAFTTANQTTIPPSTSAFNYDVSVDVTNLVNDIYASGQNNGFIVMLGTESYYRSMVFISSDNAIADSTRFPKLVLNFTLPIKPISGNNGPLCEGDTLQLTSSTVTGATYNWTGPNGFTSTAQNITIPNAAPAASGTYIVTTHMGIFSASDTTIVIINPKPAPPAVTPNINYCQGAVANALSATGANLLWYTAPSGGTGSPAAPTPSTVSTGTTTYYVSQTVNGCESNRASIQVTVHPIPSAPVVVSPVNLCLNMPAPVLNVNGSNILWYTSASGGTGTPVQPVINTAVADTLFYYVSQTVNGCESPRTPIEVIVSETVSIDLSVNKDTICQSDTLTLTAVLNGQPVTIISQYLDGGIFAKNTNPYQIYWTTPGLKTIVFKVSNTICEATDSVNIFVVPSAGEAFFQIKDNACVGEAVTLTPDWQYPGSVYNWNLGNADKVDSTFLGNFYLTWDTEGVKTISLSLTLNDACLSAPYTKDITINEVPDAHITASRYEVCANDTIHLTADYIPGAYYTWFPEKNFASPHAAASDVTIYYGDRYFELMVRNSFDCSAYDTVEIEVQPCCHFYVPDAFTPNGDGRNDIFKVITEGNNTFCDLKIYNRWGQIVFQTANTTRGWDGTFNGEPQNLGTYYYYLKYKCSNGNIIEKKGDITLLR